jgi:hypothetical protein
MPTKLVRPAGRMVEGKTAADARLVDAGPLAPFAVRGASASGKSASVDHLDAFVFFLSIFDMDVPGGVRTPSEIVDARLRAIFESLRGGSGSGRMALVVDGADQGSQSAWEHVNERRLSLIEKDIDQGLSVAEKAELDELEKKAEDYMDANAPVSFEMIDRLKECAARDGLAVKLD